ncbi:hypothetical protein JCM19992_00940 [Thermostilla marina]
MSRKRLRRFLRREFEMYLVLALFAAAMWFVVSGSFVVQPVAAAAEPWKPAPCPLMTPWGEKIDPENVWPEYPRPMLVRAQWLNLNGLWQFEFIDQDKRPEKIPFSRDLGRRILVPFPWESALSGIREFHPQGRAWYRRTFRVPEAWQGKRIHLNFEAVDWECAVFVDGKYAGGHRGGYDPFSIDITDYLADRDAHELLVYVYDPGSDRPIARGKQSNGKFADPQGFSYTPSSGIWQTVWLEPVDPVHLAELTITPRLAEKTVTFSCGISGLEPDVTYRVIVRDGETTIASGETRADKELTLPIPQPKPWTPDHPFLYDAEIVVLREGRPVDHVESYFGMRDVGIATIDGVPKIVLNGRFVFQMGPLDQGFWPDGLHTPPSDEAMRWDIEGIKDFGFNMIRKHIKVEPRRWYYWCDKLGILVWQDMPSTFGEREYDDRIQFEAELERMIRTHESHPSIIMWVVFNEHWGIYDPYRMTRKVTALDPTRLVNTNSGFTAGKRKIDYQAGHVRDIHHYRPPGPVEVIDDRVAVLGEYGAIGYLVDGHVWDPDGPWVHFNYENFEKATAEYEHFIAQLTAYKRQGVCAAVYTQWTDVENEMNGLYTYDRKVMKLDRDRVRQANRSTYRDDLPYGP